MPSHAENAPTHTLRVAFLGSGSGGNAAAVTDGTTTLLVDCGFSAREVARRMCVHGLDAASVSALLLTHEHGDHVRGVEVFSRRFGCSVWATEGTRRAARLDDRVVDVRRIVVGETFSVGTLDVLSFRSSHDAAEPVGFVISDRAGSRLGIATDTGAFTPEAAAALRGCETIGIECNHDVDMLETGPYPFFLKRRIASAHGHLSNADAADALELVASGGLAHVYALHLSRTNNTHDLARSGLEARLTQLGLSASVTSVPQDLPAPTLF